jgi:uncharacterized protein with HEPN domain
MRKHDPFVASVDFDILWQIVSQDLPPRIATLESIVPSASSAA